MQCYYIGRVDAMQVAGNSVAEERKHAFSVAAIKIINWVVQLRWWCACELSLTSVVEHQSRFVCLSLVTLLLPRSYEAYGPGGTGFIIEALTDNVNRTAGAPGWTRTSANQQ